MNEYTIKINQEDLEKVLNFLNNNCITHELSWSK
jgi:hypothetical protein